MRQRIAVFVPSSANIGDSVHHKGLEYILDKVFPKESFSRHYIIQDRNYYHYGILRSDYSHIIIGGSPYIYAKFYDTYKYGNEMRQLLKANKKAVKILCGGGSHFPEHYTVKDIVKEDPQFISELVDFYWDFDLIIVRDSLAKEVFDEAGLEAYLLPCPSVFIFKKYPEIKLKKKRTVPVFIPKTSMPSDMSPSILSTLKRAEIETIQQSILKKFCSLKIGVVHFEDFEFIRFFMGEEELPARKVLKLNSLLDLFTLLSEAKFVVSARVHSAIPASLLGLPSYLIPLDSRKRCVEFFDIKEIKSLEDIRPYSLDRMSPTKIDMWEDKYVSLLRRCL